MRSALTFATKRRKIRGSNRSISGADKRHLQVAPNSRGRVSVPSYRFERLTS
jgi:hypothetical protein